MGEGRQDLADLMAVETGEASVSLDAGKAQPFGRSRAGKPAMAWAFLSWAVTTGTAQLAKVNFQPLPPSIITLSDAQIAKIRG
jgi:hypothetical protein